MKFLLCVVFVCFLGAESARVKKPKAVKLLIPLCDAVNASSLFVKDPAYDDVFSDIDEFCEEMFKALGREPSGNNKTVDGVKVVTKVCKWFNKKYDEEPTEGPLVGLGEVCNATAEAKSQSLADKSSRKALAKLDGLCMAQQTGSLAVPISNFTEVFEDLEDFCDAYLNETLVIIQTARGEGGMVNGVKTLGYVCKWYTKKFTEEPAEGALGGLSIICMEFDEVVQALKDEKEEEEEEEDDDDDLPQ